MNWEQYVFAKEALEKARSEIEWAANYYPEDMGKKLWDMVHELNQVIDLPVKYDKFNNEVWVLEKEGWSMNGVC